MQSARADETWIWAAAEYSSHNRGQHGSSCVLHSSHRIRRPRTGRDKASVALSPGVDGSARACDRRGRRPPPKRCQRRQPGHLSAPDVSLVPGHCHRANHDPFVAPHLTTTFLLSRLAHSPCQIPRYHPPQVGLLYGPATALPARHMPPCGLITLSAVYSTISHATLHTMCFRLHPGDGRPDAARHHSNTLAASREIRSATDGPPGVKGRLTNTMTPSARMLHCGNAAKPAEFEADGKIATSKPNLRSTISGPVPASKILLARRRLTMELAVIGAEIPPPAVHRPGRLRPRCSRRSSPFS